MCTLVITWNAEMMKSFKNQRALSPVVAAIILIAVTVAVAVEVGTWDGVYEFLFHENIGVEYCQSSLGF